MPKRPRGAVAPTPGSRNLAESDDVRREQRREELGEPYRTMLGHFRQEIAHCYWPVLVRLFWQWNNDDDMGHGMFVPVLSAYIAWQLRDRFRDCAQPHRLDF